jgi:two-component system, OmpR family, sensor histidine kinase SenX3
MRIASRRGTLIFFLVFGVSLAAVATAVGFGWIILNWQEGVKLLLGIIFFGAITTGLVLNTIFLVREVRRNEQHDSFINAVTHELKTPIASLRLYLQTLEQREVSPEQRREFYKLMLDDTDRLLGTVEQVLKAGAAGHKRKGQRVAVDFGSLVGECVEIARNGRHLPTEAIQFVAATNGAGAQVNGDPEELRTAVANVLDNAIKYSGGKVDVAVRVEAPDTKHIRLSVKDHGVGIPPEELKRIFRRFYRVSSLAQVKGTGLGLFIVKAIAKKHGGRAFALSEGEGHGTTVVFELPRSAQT